MGFFKTGSVVRVLGSDGRLVRVSVKIGGDEIEAVGFPHMIAPMTEGDRVVVNTTGLDLALGTGGDGFVLWNIDGAGELEGGHGHIVKMRYTPWQTEVMAAEAPESPHHDSLASIDRIEAVPVVACGLHSQVGAIAAGVKAAAPEARVGYLMSDGGALPLAWSKSLIVLRDAGLIDVTGTYGHAFGGDLEAVNVFSGLVAMVHAGEADVVIAGTGPGVVGTGSSLGFSAIEQGQILDASVALGGSAIAALRISFADSRRRHAGVSHHTLTALSVAARERCVVVVPELPEARAAEVMAQIRASDVPSKHDLVTADGGPGLRLLGDRKVRPTSMGRDIEETPELFVAASAAGAYAGALVGDTLDP